MNSWYRPAFVFSILIHAAIFAALDPFAMNSRHSSTIEVELVLNSDNGTQHSLPAPAPVKRSTAKAAPVAPVMERMDDVATSSVASTPEVSSPSNENSKSVEAAAPQAVASILSPEQQYLADVRRILESKKNYPMAARRLGHQGRVIVRFVVGRDGQIIEAKITQGSTSDILNRAARSLIENIGGLKPFPTEIRLAEWAVTVPIEYQM